MSEELYFTIGLIFTCTFSSIYVCSFILKVFNVCKLYMYSGTNDIKDLEPKNLEETISWLLNPYPSTFDFIMTGVITAFLFFFSPMIWPFLLFVYMCIGISYFLRYRFIKRTAVIRKLRGEVKEDVYPTQNIIRCLVRKHNSYHEKIEKYKDASTL